ncbi:hypothetical protein HELRODRAFT_165503 [Helobdella robusta]|uniref:Uncharacterized protein n=1 Tax=Helobdella robusta TaxID=6412 RepID=T1EWX5_HELRO|nr:hypothetical protein HELRODRAFT_165503 [Helobdella robusta]ESN91465.1 hypothetical protein HELRODRAFT_165503 [Helobdella robusta]
MSIPRKFIIRIKLLLNSLNNTDNSSFSIKRCNYVSETSNSYKNTDNVIFRDSLMKLHLKLQHKPKLTENQPKLDVIGKKGQQPHYHTLAWPTPVETLVFHVEI